MPILKSDDDDGKITFIPSTGKFLGVSFLPVISFLAIGLISLIFKYGLSLFITLLLYDVGFIMKWLFFVIVCPLILLSLLFRFRASKFTVTVTDKTIKFADKEINFSDIESVAKTEDNNCTMLEIKTKESSADDETFLQRLTKTPPQINLSLFSEEERIRIEEYINEHISG